MKATFRISAIFLTMLLGLSAQAHVPYLEERDFSPGSPFVCRSATQSIAVYGWLESATDVDVYAVKVTRDTTFYAGVLVPVFDQYAEFRPSFALIGPGLPQPAEKLPVEIQPGQGAIVLHDSGAANRKRFYEPFGNKSYFKGPEIEMRLAPGEYRLVYWDPRGKKGDYVAAIGKKELWPVRDVLRALRITPIIRRGGELHLAQTKETKE